MPRVVGAVITMGIPPDPNDIAKVKTQSFETGALVWEGSHVQSCDLRSALE